MIFKKKLMLLMLCLIMLFTTQNVFVKAADSAASSTKRVVAYFPNWGVYNINHHKMRVKDIPWHIVTHINHAFFTVASDFTLASTDPDADFGWINHMADYEKYKSLNPHVKVLVSVGGWTRSENFHAMAKTRAGRKTFIDSTIKFLQDYPFIDGIDLNWEYPGVDRPRDPNDMYDRGAPGGPEDKENFTLLLKEMREAMNGNRMGDKLLTIAVSAGYDKVEGVIEPDKFHQYLSFINVMTYDFNGAWSNTTNSHTPLYANPNAPESTEAGVDTKGRYNTDSAMKMYSETFGVPGEKLTVGTPFYSRGWANVIADNADNALFAPATGNYHGAWDDPQNPKPGGQVPYFRLVELEKTPGWEKGRDSYGGTPYLYNKSLGVFLTYEDEQSLRDKADYVNNNGYGGLVIWQVTGDIKSQGFPMISLAYEHMVKQFDGVLPLNSKLTLTMGKEYNDYTLTAGLQKNHRANKIALYENGKEIESRNIQSGVLSYDFSFNDKGIGNYSYEVRLYNQKGYTASNRIDLSIGKPSLKAAKLSIDNPITSGDYKITAVVPAGNTAKELIVKQNGVEVARENLKPASSEKQVFVFDFNDMPASQYTYIATLSDGIQTIDSQSLDIEVRDGVFNSDYFDFEFGVTSDWGTGFNFQGKLTNTSRYELENITLTFSYDGKIDSIWSDMLLDSKQGNVYTLKPQSYKPTLKPGESLTFGGGSGRPNPGTAPYNLLLEAAIVGGNGGTDTDPVLKIPTLDVDKATNTGDYKITVTVDKNSTGKKLSLIENGTVIKREDLIVASKDKQRFLYNFSGAAEGTYTYMAKIEDDVKALHSREVKVVVLSEDTGGGGSPDTQKHLFAPYVDVTLWQPKYSMEDVRGIDFFVMAFIVSDRSGQPLPRWGSYTEYDMTFQKEAVDAVRARGGDVMISIGGANNSPLAATASSANELKNIYAHIIDSYDLKLLDFDIEGHWVMDRASIRRRSEAIKLLQDDPRYKDVGIWYTLPALPTGLVASGLDIVNDAVSRGVRLSGVNVMAMEYGSSFVPNPTKPGDLAAKSVELIENLRRQLDNIYRSNSITKTSKELYKMIGITPMIGQNNNRNEVFYPKDAEILTKYAMEKEIGLLSMWSLERDQGGTVGQATFNHSGLDTKDLEFSNIFREFMTLNGGDNVPPDPPTPPDPTDPTDPPAESDTYKHNKIYYGGEIVTYNGKKYKAKWWTKGEAPDKSDVWELVAGENGSVNEWNSSKAYNGGDTVTYKGKKYKAKWWTKGEAPDASGVWEPITGENGSTNEWNSSKTYNGGDKVTYKGLTYRAKWWTRGEIPGNSNVWDRE